MYADYDYIYTYMASKIVFYIMHTIKFKVSLSASKCMHVANLLIEHNYCNHIKVSCTFHSTHNN